MLLISGSEKNVTLILFLIYSYVVDIVFHRECFVVNGATVVTTNRQVEENVLWLLERLGFLAQLAIHSFALLDFVEQFIRLMFIIC